MQSPTKFRAGIIGTTLAFILIVQWLEDYPHIVEKYYSNGLYPILSLLVSSITNQFGFSISEFFVWFVVLILGPVFLTRIFSKKMTIARGLLNLTMLMSMFLVWFYLFWGLNYLRVPLTEKLQLDEVQLEIDAFDSTFVDVISRTNDLNLYYPIDDIEQINAVIDSSYCEVLANLGLRKVSGSNRSKTLVDNWVLNKTTTSGFFSPFFHEVHYNDDLLVIELPFVIAHEKAHQMGYANEAEANLLAFLVCKNSREALVQYSGYFNILGYFLQNVKGDLERRKQFTTQLAEGVKLDLVAVRERWKSHYGVISQISGAGYDLYLKANRVKEGRRSYSRVVDLVIKYSSMKNQIPKPEIPNPKN